MMTLKWFITSLFIFSILSACASTSETIIVGMDPLGVTGECNATIQAGPVTFDVDTDGSIEVDGEPALGASVCMSIVNPSTGDTLISRCEVFEHEFEESEPVEEESTQPEPESSVELTDE